MIKTPDSLLQAAADLERYYQKAFPAAAPFAAPCFLSTVETTVQPLEDGRYFVVTGDIPAMWLRDSSVQVANYIPYAAHDASVQAILRGVIAKQADDVCIDAYANAFNACANGNGFQDITHRDPAVWERKYEVDSLCAPLYLAHRYWKETGDDAIFSARFQQMLRRIAAVFLCEQNHAQSPYSFERLNAPQTDTLSCAGRGTPVGYTGMTWSGFRPSDDRCEYGYLIPANMMACIAMEKAADICEHVYADAKTQELCLRLSKDIRAGLLEHGVAEHPGFGTVYAYETDGLGRHILMDDANVPSLLSAPYLGYCRADDPIYQSTRRFVLSSRNPYFYKGSRAQGVGSPHTPQGYVWPIALTMQALTASCPDEVLRCLQTLVTTHADTFQMHESFDVEKPEAYTRPWFAWANTLFASLLIKLMKEGFFE